ncbi:MAG: nuclear transport factor 2 family protein [Chloroflexi bacterium]|nr:nuclear transport factor 2 family protein [Chloroflexota bacterium]
MESRKENVRKFWEGLDNGDLDSQLALLADDAVFTVTGSTGVSGVHRGVDGVRAHMERFGSLIEPGPRMNVVELIGEADTVVCLSEGVMRSRTGREYNNRYAFVFRFDGPKISSITEYLDTALVETALYNKEIR